MLYFYYSFIYNKNRFNLFGLLIKMYELILILLYLYMYKKQKTKNKKQKTKNKK